jgi:hypothetical protein
MIRLYDPVRTVVRKNYIKTTSGAAAAGNAILIQNTSQYCIIEDNMLVNSGSATGFEKGILFDGGGGSVGADHFFDTISKNLVTAFAGGSAEGISLTNADNTLVHGNRVWQCQQPFVASQSKWLNIAHNNFNSSNNAPSVSVTGSATQNIVIAFNDIANGNSALTSRIVEVESNSNTFGGQIIGNHIQLSTLLGTTSKAALYIDGPEWVVRDNFIGCASVLGWFISESPLTLSANAVRCIVEGNNLYHAVIFGAPARITDSGTLNIERLNVGITYYADIPVSRAFTESGTAWEFFMVATPYKTEFRNASGTSEQAGLEFSNLDIPEGARLVAVHINAQVQDTSDLSVAWRKASYTGTGSSGTQIVAATNPSSAGSYATFTLTPGSNQYMADDEVHLLAFSTDGSLSGTVWIAGVRVEYLV